MSCQIIYNNQKYSIESFKDFLDSNKSIFLQDFISQDRQGFKEFVNNQQTQFQEDLEISDEVDTFDEELNIIDEVKQEELEEEYDLEVDEIAISQEENFPDREMLDIIGENIGYQITEGQWEDMTLHEQEYLKNCYGFKK